VIRKANKADKTEAKDQLNADCSTAYRTHSISIINETAAGIEIAFWVLFKTMISPRQLATYRPPFRGDRSAKIVRLTKTVWWIRVRLLVLQYLQPGHSVQLNSYGTVMNRT